MVIAAFLSFLVAAVFWSVCLFSRVRDTKLLGFWYAVFFDNAGYILLVVQSVTSA